MRKYTLWAAALLAISGCAGTLPAPDGDDGGVNRQGTPMPQPEANAPEAPEPEGEPAPSPEGEPAPGPEGQPSPEPGPQPDAEPAPNPQDRAAFCRDHGPVVEVPFGNVPREICAGEIAEALFGQALCVCADYHAGGGLFTRGFDSRVGAPDPNAQDGGGSVGINGRYAGSHGATAVGGSLIVASTEVNNFLGGMHVAGDLKLGGDAHQPGITTVGRDAWLGGGFFGGPLHVVRDLHRGGQIASLHNTVGGQSLEEQVVVDAPCDCANPFDANIVVNQLRNANENALIGLAPGDLSGVGVRHDLELPCGRYYVDEITGAGEIAIRITGRVALAVGRDVRVAGRLTFDIAPGAELDLFIGGTIVIVGHHVFGDPDRPAATRVYVASNEEIHIVGGNVLMMNLYAPQAHVQTVGIQHVLGSIFARTMLSGGILDITYDRAISEIDCGEEDGDDGDPGPDGDMGQCGRCSDCTDGLACVGGTCGACQQDSDCCKLDICDAGRCRPF